MSAVTLARLSDVASIAPSTCEGRLTLETGVAISTTDQTAKTTLYFTPYKGNRISTYSGSAWSTSSFTEKSISLAGLTANTNYDCFIVDGTLALELVAWSSDTARATALVLQDGVYVKTGATTRRYLGTIRITGTTGQCESSAAKRFVWNLYNQVQTLLGISEATANWSYSTATWRQARATAANKIEMVCGLAQPGIRVLNHGRVGPPGTGYGIIGIGLNRTTANDGTNALYIAPSGSGSEISLVSEYVGSIALGYTYFAAVEFAGASGVTFYGSGELSLSTLIAA